MVEKDVNKTVVVLGAGISGIVTARWAKYNNLQPIILEKNSSIGGVWNQNTGYTWKGMRTNLSKYSCSFEGFDWPKNVQIFPSSEEVSAYVNKYVENFDLAKHIMFNSKVLSVKQEDLTKLWVVKYEDQEKEHGELETIKAPYVVVATGIFADPNMPNIPGIQNYEGRLLHSSDYKDGAKFSKQKVLVVGGSLSGAEIASDLSKHASHVTHIFREPFWVLERYIKVSEKTKLPIDFAFYNRKFYVNNIGDKESSIINAEKHMKKNSYMLSLCKKQYEIKDLCIDPKDFSCPIKIVISDTYIKDAASHKLIPKKTEISKCSGYEVEFTNSEKDRYDAIVMATGYQINVSFLDDEIKEAILYEKNHQIQPTILYKTAMHPKLHNMFFVGIYKGPYFAVIEHQAKWACAFFAGKDLPTISNEEIERGIREEIDIRNMKPQMQFPHPDYVKFADEIAKISGADLDLCSLKEKDSSLFTDFISMPVFPGYFSTTDVEVKIKHLSGIVAEHTVYTEN